MYGKKYRTSVRVTFVIIIILTAGIVAEGGARLLFHYREQIKSLLGSKNPLVPALDLDECEMPDPRHPGNWLLRPGFSQTAKQVIEAKEAAGNIIAVKYYRESVSSLGIKNDDVILQINKDGFKGPEIDKTHSRLRILTIGDSCTFGTIEKFTYPRTLERELRRLGKKVEVVNGGVKGYSPRNVLFRIEEFKALKPEIITIYIGWNALYRERQAVDSAKLEKYFYSIRLFEMAYDQFYSAVVGRQKAALAAYKKAKHPDKRAYELRKLEAFVPSFMPEVEQIVREMQSVGSSVVIVTLPGLYVMHENPTERALKVGHLPAFTDNPFVLAKMSEQYNIALRKLAEQRGLGVIDLEEWSEAALKPRDAYFFDSVHLYDEGQEMIGRYMARELMPFLSGDQKQ